MLNTGRSKHTDISSISFDFIYFVDDGLPVVLDNIPCGLVAGLNGEGIMFVG